MIKNAKQFLHRLSAFALSVLVLAGALLSNMLPVHAADGAIYLNCNVQIQGGKL